ncbi:MAG: hypothetical protein HQM09_09445 [Candidatus Riflebacteria bacterium]|nr:hypothetical protein [Candidatus Riflebacteria bacterium]
MSTIRKSLWQMFASVIITVFFIICSGAVSVFALPVANPDDIKLLGMVSIGEEGAAWLRIGKTDVLVTPGYMLTRDLRITAVRQEGVVLYRNQARTYHVLPPVDELGAGERMRDAMIWCSPMPLWKTIRMIALAYRKDYICHGSATVEVAPRRHVQNMIEMLDFTVTPNHRWHGREGIIYTSPVHVGEADWEWFNRQVRNFKSARLVPWFNELAKKGSLISDGKPLDRVLQEIGFKIKVPIKWAGAMKFPVYCSLKNRPWHEIIENILLFNGLGLTPTQEGLVVQGGIR